MKNPRGGYTLAELAVAITVVTAALAMLIALLVVARRSAALQSERGVAAGLAQGTLERLRGSAPALLPGRKPAAQEPPPEARQLKNVKIAASSDPWKEEQGIRHVKVTVSWTSRTGAARRVSREALVSDARER